MTETFINLFQLLITGICTVIATIRAVRADSRKWAMLGLFSALFFMGDFYWQMFLFFYGETPQYSFIPYMSWYASYLFLLMLLITVRGSINKKPILTVLCPVLIFTVSLCVYYMSFGDYAGNIISTVLMSMLLYHSINGLRVLRSAEETQTYRHWIYISVLFFCFAEYGSWTASCFSEGNPVRNLYYLFDMLLSISFIMMLVSAGKAVDR